MNSCYQIPFGHYSFRFFDHFFSQKTILRCFLFLSSWCLSLATFAHEIRPAYLEINQISDSTYRILWKVPVLNNKSPKLDLVLPFTTQEIHQKLLSDAYIRQQTAVYHPPLQGKSIGIRGLELTLIDALVQINLKDDISYSFLLHPNKTTYTIPETPSQWQVAKLYTELGIEHILIGIDHLLFILGLLLLVNNWRVLIQTITAFTIAHSITLGLSALGLVRLPQAPVEAIIALSIVFLAREYLMVLRGKSSLTVQYPWIVAFSFGLLHGFGFAGVLQEIGLPQQQITLALFTFNIGVELGQLLFIGAMLLLSKLLKPLNALLPKWTVFILPYTIGIIAMFWLIERILGF